MSRVTILVREADSQSRRELVISSFQEFRVAIAKMSSEKRARTATHVFYALAFFDMCEEEEWAHKQKQARHTAQVMCSSADIALANSMTRAMAGRMSEMVFRKTFRFRRATYEAIRARIGSHEAAIEHAGRPLAASLDARLLMTLEYLATGKCCAKLCAEWC